MGVSITELLRTKAANYAAEAKANAPLIDEWCDSIRRLFDQVKCWLKELDLDQIIEVKDLDWKVKEPGLGEYKAPRIDLRGLGKWVGFVPKARRPSGGSRPLKSWFPSVQLGESTLRMNFCVMCCICFHRIMWTHGTFRNPPRLNRVRLISNHSKRF